MRPGKEYRPPHLRRLDKQRPAPVPKKWDADRGEYVPITDRMDAPDFADDVILDNGRAVGPPPEALSAEILASGDDGPDVLTDDDGFDIDGAPNAEPSGPPACAFDFSRDPFGGLAPVDESPAAAKPSVVRETAQGMTARQQLACERISGSRPIPRCPSRKRREEREADEADGRKLG